MEFAFNEWHSEEKETIERINQLESILFQNKEKGQESAWRDEALVNCITQI